MWDSIKNLFRKEVVPTTPAEDSKEDRQKMRITNAALLSVAGENRTVVNAFALPTAPPGVVPEKATMAMDDAMAPNYAYALNSTFSEGIGFLGYTYLAELTQRPEYRKPSEIIAKEMTRKWMKLQCTGEENKDDKIKAIEAELERLNVQELFKKAAEHDGFFGRGQIYLDVGANDKQDELKMPLAVSADKIGKGMLQRIGTVEPMWMYPNMYNSIDPLKEDFYKPDTWFVMGKLVHASRFLFFNSLPVPDMLKPAYAFGGLSLTQICKPYVDNWLRTRQSVSDLLHSFSVMGLKTNLSEILQGGAAQQVQNRAQLFNQCRDNRGLMMLDKDTEDLFNVSAPLGSLDKLQAQAQEQMASVAGIPLIVLLKITPSGLNASSDGEIETFYNWIEAQQEAIFSPPLKRLLEIVQLSLFGEIDAEIGFKWQPLWSLDEGELATAHKTQVEADIELINAGVLSPQEVRNRIANEEDSAYAGLDVDDIPDPPEDPVTSNEDNEGILK